MDTPRRKKRHSSLAPTLVFFRWSTKPRASGTWLRSPPPQTLWTLRESSGRSSWLIRQVKTRPNIHLIPWRYLLYVTPSVLSFFFFTVPVHGSGSKGEISLHSRVWHSKQSACQEDESGLQRRTSPSSFIYFFILSQVYWFFFLTYVDKKYPLLFSNFPSCGSFTTARESLHVSVVNVLDLNWCGCAKPLLFDQISSFLSSDQIQRAVREDEAPVHCHCRHASPDPVQESVPAVQWCKHPR